MKIYIATFTSVNGTGDQKLFFEIQKAKKRLRGKYDKEIDSRYFDDKDKGFYEWCACGAWNGKIKAFNIKD